MHSSSSLRQWLRELRAQLANTHTDINTVHALLAAPLIWLGIDCPSDNSISTVATPPVEATLITRIQLVESAFPEHTRFLLRHVCVNWTLAFTNEQRKQYFDPYFLWISNKDTTTSTTTSTEMRLLLGAIHANSLRTLTNALSEDWANQDRFIMSTVWRLLTSLIQQLDIATLYKSQMDTTTKTTPTWHDIANILCSLPTRVSNAMAGGSPVTPLLETTMYFRHITRLIHDALEVEYIEDSDTNYELFLKHMSQFIERCIRLGYGETMTPTLLATHRRSVHNVWPHLLTRIALPQKHQLLKLILQELMHSTRDIDSAEQTLINALIQPDYLCSTNEWTQEQKNMYIHTIQQCLINTQWTSWMVYAFIKHIMSILDQQMDKDDIQSQILNQLIGHWGERVFIQSVDRAGQQRITQIILFMLKHVTRKAVKDVAHTSIFLDAINRRLDSMNHFNRKIGMITAEAFSDIASSTEDKLDFDLDAKDADVILLRSLASTPKLPEQSTTIDDTQLVSTLTPNDNEVEQEQEHGYEGNDDDDDDPDALVRPIDELSDQEEEEEQYKELNKMKDESTEWKTRKPRYLRDLVQYLKSDDDIDKWMVGITSAAELIDLVTEETLAVWAVSLARQLVHLQDTFEQPEFIPALRAALISLMKKSDEATRYIIQFMSDRDCSLSRRVLLLDCIRQLTHYLNELPAPIDKEEAKVLQPTGTVVWTSSRLQLATSQGTTKWMQRHSAIIQQLLDASLDNDPRSIILQDVLTLRAYITTLADMLALSKNSPDLWRLCHPFIELLMPLRYHPNPEIVEIVLVGFIAIVSTLNANVHTEFLSYIRPIHDWLTGLFTESAAVQLQPQIVTLGSALSAFSEKAEVNIHQMLDHLDIE